MVIVALLTALLLCPAAAPAQDTADGAKPTLTVTGTGHLAVPPDTAFVTLGMETAAKSLAEAQRLNRTVMNDVVDRLRQLQIEPGRIQTSSFTVSPQYKPPARRPADAPPAPPEIIGYVVSNSLTVEVRNLEQVGRVIEHSLAAGANRFHGLQWGLRDEHQATLGALQQAAVKARDKAAALSKAVKVKLMRLVSASENGQVIRPSHQPSRTLMTSEAAGGEPPMLPGEMKVEATVTLVYEIGQE